MFQDFVNQVLASGQKVGTNGANYGECVGLVQDWFQAENEPFFYGDAKDLYANAPDGYTKGTSWPAPEGSAGVMDGSWGGGHGHTWLSFGDGRVFEQNNPPGHPPKISTYGPTTPSGYIGWILPNNYKGDQEMSLTPEEIDIAVKVAFNRPATPDELQRFAGANTKDVLLTLLTNNESERAHASQFDVLQADDNAQKQKVAELQDQLNKVSVPVTPVGPTTTAIGVTTPDSVTVSKDGLWASFKKFLGL